METPANVLISDSGRVIAEIRAKTVSIAGAYKGTITADRVELLEGGRLWGAIHVNSFLLDEGSHFHGELNIREEKQIESEPLLAPRPATDAQIPVEMASDSDPLD